MNKFNLTQRHLLLTALLFAIALSYIPAQAKPFRIVNDDIIIDQSGRQIHVSKRFERIISLYGAHTENLFALGLDQEIIGVTNNEVYPPAASNKTVFSYHDDPEKFLVARPDIVLIRPMIDRAYAQLITRLEKSGITVLSLQPANINEMFTYWKILGILTGKENRANQMTRHFETAAREFKSLSQTIENKKRVYFEAMHSQMKTFTSQAMAIFALECAGGINIAPDAESSRGTNIGIYGKEHILSHADEIDVYLAQSGVMNHPTFSLIKNEPGFNTIKAVKNNRIHTIDEMIVSRPSFRLLNGIYEIGSILYPNIFDQKAQNILKRAYAFK